MSDKDFGATEFALGSVIGYRAWDLNEQGRLVGYSQTEWLPGEFQAVCHGSLSKEQLAERGLAEADWSIRHEATEQWKNTGHSLLDCTHGFYAYFGDRIGYHAQGAQKIVGIIEGYGETVVGTQGFRSMRAKILAISTESESGIWRIEDHVIERLTRNYQGVEFFGSTFAMLAKFPTSRSSEFAELAS